MTEKEKAEAYDRAIKRAKKWYNAPNIDKIPIYGNRLIERIFPEINESEDSSDEDIIKTAILNYLKKMWGNYQLDVCGIHVEDAINWLEKQGKKSSWKPSKEEMDVLYSLSYITNKYDEHKEDVITHLYQDLKREFFNDSSYENMFSLDNKEDDVRRRSTIQVLEYARSLDAYNQYGKADIDKNIAWLKEQGEQEEPQVYETEDGEIITYSETDGYKFDPKTLKPYDRVIVRNNNGEWKCAIFSHIKDYDSDYRYDCCHMIYRYCIPYNDETKHLIGTTDEAPEYYRYWEI